MIYEITVQGHLGDGVAAAFDEFDVRTAAGTTTLHGDVVDQAALHGVLDRIAGYGLVLLDVRSTP